MGAASYVTGSHNFRFGAQFTQRRLAAGRAVDRRRAAGLLQRRRAQSVTLRLPMDARNGIKMDLGIFVQDRWTSPIASR